MIISYFDDIDNIFHIFNGEIYTIWNFTKENINNFSILLKINKNTNVNKWRIDMFRSVYKNVYINFIEDINVKNEIKNTYIIKKFKWGFIDSHTFKSYNKSFFYCSFVNKIKQYYNIEHNKINKVLLIIRGDNRNLYDYKSKELLSKILNDKLTEINIPFESVSFDNLTLYEQINYLKDVKILISIHGAALTNLIFLPKDSYVFEINFRTYWNCDPVCSKHKFNKISYTTKCDGKLSYKDYFHKADYHNLSQLFGKKYIEFDIEDANTFLTENHISLKNIFVNSDILINKINEIYTDI